MIIDAEKTTTKASFSESDVTTWTDADNEWATAELEALFGSEPETPGWYRMDVLADLIEAYEAIHYPFPRPSADLARLLLTP